MTDTKAELREVAKDARCAIAAAREYIAATEVSDELGKRRMQKERDKCDAAERKLNDLEEQIEWIDE
jgi:hypothetical protein